MLWACLAVVLFPFHEAAGGLKTASWLGDYPAGVAVRGYGLIRSAMPWLVVGMLFTLVWPGPVIQRWALAAVAACFAVGWLVLPEMGWNEARDLLFVIPGLAAGAWIGERSRSSETLAAVAHSPTNAPADSRDDYLANAPAEAPARAFDAAPRGMPVVGGADRPSSAPRPAATRLARRAAALLLLAAGGLTLIDFPAWRFELALGLAAYGALLWFRPWAWLLVVPAALPLLDLAPWTGRFFWDEFDLLMLATLAVGLWRGWFDAVAWRVSKLRVLLPAFVLVTGVSLVLGLLQLPDWDANAFSAYWSHYNSLRLAKGLLWGLVFYGLYRSAPSIPGSDAAFTTLCAGMALGVLGVSAWALWEQVQFAGAASGADYRVTGSFSSMHTGGGHFEAYLVIALPFVWGLIFLSRWWWLRALAGAVFLLGAYALFSTVARGGAIALAVALVILIAGTWLALGRRARPARSTPRWALPALLGAATLGVMVIGASGTFWQQRIAQTGADADIRLAHWSEVLGLRDDGLTTLLFGAGLGRLPAANLASQLPSQAGSYRYADDNGNTYLALNSAGTLYMAQRLPPAPGQALTLQLSARAPAGQAGLEASLCEKNLFNSHRCQWLKLDVPPGAKDWQSFSQTFSSGEVGAGNWFTRRPVQFSLYNPLPGTVIEVDNVRLLDASGRDLLKNGDFARGGDFWFFKSGDHLFWHAKNLWVHLLFEQGWIGTLLFGLILLLALVRLTRRVGQGGVEPTVWLAALGALATVGVVESLLDAPRLALLVYGVLFVGAAGAAKATRKPPPPAV